MGSQASAYVFLFNPGSRPCQRWAATPTAAGTSLQAPVGQHPHHWDLRALPSLQELLCGSKVVAMGLPLKPTFVPKQGGTALGCHHSPLSILPW